MHTSLEIDDMTYKFLTQMKECKPAKLYLLPKIHKIKEDEIGLFTGQQALQQNLIIPGRPIISQCSAPTMSIGHFIDYFLVPLVKKQETYLRDTTDFINKIEATSIHKNHIMVTYDVTSMYTNIPFEELLLSVTRALEHIQSADYEIQIPKKESLIFLLEILLRNNEFHFNGIKYKQILGASMGAVPSPEICDLRMYDILHSIIHKSKLSHKIITHFRYRDDGFMIFDASTDEIHNFFSFANEEHEYLKFTYNVDLEKAIFLDTIVHKGDRFKATGILDLETFFKPTDTYLYLHHSSAHPKSTFRGLIKGEIIRYIRNTSNKEKQRNCISQFRSRLLNRGYPKAEIDKIISQSEKYVRNELLKQKDKSRKQELPLVFITHFNPRVRKLGTILRKHWGIIRNNEDLCKIFQKPPTVAYKRNKNLIELLNT